MSVWLPKNSSSSGFWPKVVSSTPMRDSCSMPGMLWQPRAAVLAHQRLAVLDQLRRLQRAVDVGVRGRRRAEREQVRRQARSPRRRSAAGSACALPASSRADSSSSGRSSARRSSAAMLLRLGAMSLFLPSRAGDSPGAKPWQPRQPRLSASSLPCATSAALVGIDAGRRRPCSREPRLALLLRGVPAGRRRSPSPAPAMNMKFGMRVCGRKPADSATQPPATAGSPWR